MGVRGGSSAFNACSACWNKANMNWFRREPARDRRSPPSINGVRRNITGPSGLGAGQVALGWLLSGRYAVDGSRLLGPLSRSGSHGSVLRLPHSAQTMESRNWSLGADKNRTKPWHHGPHPALRTGLWLRDLLVEAGCQVDFKQFQGPHTISGEAIEGTSRLIDELVG